MRINDIYIIQHVVMTFLFFILMFFINTSLLWETYFGFVYINIFCVGTRIGFLMSFSYG